MNNTDDALSEGRTEPNESGAGCGDLRYMYAASFVRQSDAQDFADGEKTMNSDEIAMPCGHTTTEAWILTRAASIISEKRAYNPDSYLANYAPNDPKCPICRGAVEPQHARRIDPATKAVSHDYCVRAKGGGA